MSAEAVVGLKPMLQLDLASLATWRKVGPLILVAAALMTWQGGIQLSIPMLFMGGYLIAVNAFTMDDNHRLAFLYGALPVTRRTVITSHYLLAVAALLAMAGLAALMAVLSAATRPNTELGSELGLGLGTLAGTSASVAVMIPLIIRFGSKALGYVAIGLLAFGGLVAMAVGRWGQQALAGMLGWVAGHTTLAIAAGGVLLVLIWAASYLVARRLFDAKDF